MARLERVIDSDFDLEVFLRDADPETFRREVDALVQRRLEEALLGNAEVNHEYVHFCV